MSPCPRCAHDNPPTAAACGACGMPLALPDEPAPRPLDRPLDLDRRGREREPGDGPGEPASGPVVEAEPAVAPFDPNRSDWRLGAPAEPADAPDDAPDGARADETGVPSGEAGLRPAPAVRRAVAWAVDGALVAAAGAVLEAALLGASGALRGTGSLAGAVAASLPVVVPGAIFVAILAFVYATAAHALAGATLGKRLAGIRVVDAEGRAPTFGRAAARSAWTLASLALLGLGLLPALLSPSGRALHDLLAGTRVVAEP